MDILEVFVCSVLAAVFAEFSLSRRMRIRWSAFRIATMAALVGSMVWCPAFFVIKHLEWSWKTGPLRFDFDHLAGYVVVAAIWFSFVLPAPLAAGWFLWRRGTPVTG